jgi:hypothetical protein
MSTQFSGPLSSLSPSLLLIALSLLIYLNLFFVQLLVRTKRWWLIQPKTLRFLALRAQNSYLLTYIEEEESMICMRVPWYHH